MWGSTLIRRIGQPMIGQIGQTGRSGTWICESGRLFEESHRVGGARLLKGLLARLPLRLRTSTETKPP
jgi:hypothetical protein